MILQYQILCFILLLFKSIHAKENTDKSNQSYSFTSNELLQKRNEVSDLINFALDNYLSHAFPYDEIKPISCKPRLRNWQDPTDLNQNDILGNFSTTLFDSLTTVAIMGDKTRFIEMTQLIDSIYSPKNYSFQSNVTIQVFETTIRIIGSLISAHLYATDPNKNVYLGQQYETNPFLLKLAKDMAERLLPAYLTQTGLPYPRINLLTGTNDIPQHHISENNAAGITSPMFEFTMLSYLTNDSKFANVTRYAFDKIWQSRTDLDLIISSIDPTDGKIMGQSTGVGASMDSFYEYALKGAILFDDNTLYQIWHQSYTALNLYCKNDWFYTNTLSQYGYLANSWIDSLSAFFPGLQVLYGDVNDAIKKHLMFNKLWNTFHSIPERWAFNPVPNEIVKNNSGGADKYFYNWRSVLPLEWYPLRPEFIESTYFLYRATKDPFYLNIGYQILSLLQNEYKVECGFSGWQNIPLYQRQDRMETFVISETLKYLYLLFDENNEIHRSRDNIIFSTEAHPMWLNKRLKQNYQNNKFFNDSIYLNHLSKCQMFDEQVILIDDGQFNNQYLSFKKKTQNIDSNKYIPIQGTCFKYQFDIDNKIESPISTSSLPYSKILSETKNLFEIESRYEKSLILNSNHISDFNDSFTFNHTPMELKPQFYNQWANPKMSISKPHYTTESFELLLSFDKDYYPPTINHTNHTIEYKILSGYKKFRLEKLSMGNIDIYGSLIPEDIITTADMFNVPYDHTCQQQTQANNTIVYRATMVDGIYLQSNDKVMINGTSLLPQMKPRSSSSLFNRKNNKQDTEGDDFQLGYNHHNQLMLKCVPIINVYLI